MNDSLRLLPMAALMMAVAAPSVSAKAYYAPEGEMIKRAECIALVNITKVEAKETKAGNSTFQEQAQAEVIEVIKGTLPKTITLYGNGDFICAQIRYQPGKYLVFLGKENELWTGCNWHLSVRPIKDDTVEWYAQEGGIEVKWQPLPPVLDLIREKIQVKAVR